MAIHLPSNAPAIAVGMTSGAAITRQISPSSANARSTPPARSITAIPMPIVSPTFRGAGRLERKPATIPMSNGVPKKSTAP